MKLLELKCPSCGADLKVEDGRESVFCQYCGTKILLYNENEKVYKYEIHNVNESTHRIIDDAKIKHEEVNEKKHEHIKEVVGIIVGAILLVVLLYFFSLK